MEKAKFILFYYSVTILFAPLQYAFARTVIPHDPEIITAYDTCESIWNNNEFIKLIDKVVCFKKDADSYTDDFFFEEVSEGTDFDYFVVNSQGGNVESYLNIVENIQAIDFTLIISEYCLSSCANYLFPLAQRKIVLDNSIFGWHGGPPRNFEEFVVAASRNDNLRSYEKTYDYLIANYPELKDLHSRQEIFMKREILTLI